MGAVSEATLTPSGLRLTRHASARQARNAAPAAFNIQTRSYAEAKASPTEVSTILEQRIRGVSEESNLAETGRVLSVGYVRIERNGKAPLPGFLQMALDLVSPPNKHITARQAWPRSSVMAVAATTAAVFFFVIAHC